MVILQNPYSIHIPGSWALENAAQQDTLSIAGQLGQNSWVYPGPELVSSFAVFQVPVAKERG